MRSRRTLRGLALAFVVIGVGAGAAWATGTVGQATTTAIKACQHTANGNLRVVADASDCKSTETFLTWNVTGPKGDQGVQGDTGPKGDAGLQGPTGPAGSSGAPAPKYTQVVGSATLSTINGGAAFPITGFAWGATQALGTIGGGSGVGKVDLDDVTFVKAIDPLEPPIWLAAASGSHIPTVSVVLYAPGTSSPMLTLDLSNALVTLSAEHASGQNEHYQQVKLTAPTIAPTFGSTFGSLAASSTSGTLQTTTSNATAVASSDWSVTSEVAATSGGGAVIGRPRFSEISVSKTVDALSPTLLTALVNGSRLPTSEVQIANPAVSGALLSRIQLEQVVISNWHVVADGSAGSVPVESVSLNYTKIKQTNGAGFAQWNLAENRAA